LNEIPRGEPVRDGREKTPQKARKNMRKKKTKKKVQNARRTQLLENSVGPLWPDSERGGEQTPSGGQTTEGREQIGEKRRTSSGNNRCQASQTNALVPTSPEKSLSGT